MNQPLVSAIVPAYNHERFVVSALQSLAAQTYPALELIVSDDGSSDGTLDQARSFLDQSSGRFERLELVANEHGGIPKNVRACLERSKGDFIYMLDSDDVAVPHAIERLLPFLSAPDVALAVGNNSFIDEDGLQCFPVHGHRSFEGFLEYHTAERDFSPERDFGSYRSLIAGNYVPNGWLFRRSAIDAVGGYAAGFLLDDWELLLRLCKEYRLAYTPELLLQYRLHNGNTNRLQSHAMFLDTARILIRERAFSVAHGAEDAWESHARQVLPELSTDDFEKPGFLEALLPTLGNSELDVVRTLTTNVAQSGQQTPTAYSQPSAVLPDGSAGERIHLYASCWNDIRTLPFFFRHYDPLVERYVIFDDGSTDGSRELLEGHPRVEVRPFRWSHPDSFVLSELDQYNNAWKESRGTAHWVMVVDIDEHLWMPDLGAQLRRYRHEGVSVVPARGFEMVTDDFPSPDETLAETRRLGAPSAEMSKLALFSPDAVEELNHNVGGHGSSATGRIVAPAHDILRLLHYKYLGPAYVQDRDAALRGRLGSTDRAGGWGRHWDDSNQAVNAAIESYRHAAVDVLSADAVKGTLPEWCMRLPRLADLARQREIESAISSLEQQIQRAQRDLEETAERLSRERDEQLQRVSEVTALLSAANAERDRLRESWDSERQSLGAALEASRSRSLSLERSLEASTARVTALESSKSWRWTRPVRALASVLMRLAGTKAEP